MNATVPPHPRGSDATERSSEESTALWNRVLDLARQKVNEQTYRTWFTQTRFLDLRDGVLRLQGPNQFFVDWLTEHHLDLLEGCIEAVVGPDIEVLVQVDPKPAAQESFDSRGAEPAAHAEPTPIVRNPRDAGLNPRYIFGNFVVGENNHLASAACMAVADQLALAYNPLFLYGGVGLGKTHLMQAIGNRVLERNPSAVVHYVSAENFMNELIQSIRGGTTFEFKNRYRTVDLLLIDDIQFLAGKESTQQEFFHTFNALYDANKQIVVTSDRPPKEISALEERLRSRFEWGLITDMQAPNFETRVAILKKKVEKEDILIPDDVLVLVAESIQNNIRELEGAIIRLLAFASLTNSEINVEMAQEVLSAFIQKRQPRRDLSISDIMKAVSRIFGISLDLMRSKLRTKHVALARQVAMYICREHTRASLSQIGLQFGGRDHTTVHHAWQKIVGLRDTDPDLEREIRTVLDQLRLN